jgi:hypothetical protein
MTTISSVSTNTLQAYVKQLQQTGAAKASTPKPAQKLETQETAQDERMELNAGQQEFGESQLGRFLNLLA